MSKVWNSSVTFENCLWFSLTILETCKSNNGACHQAGTKKIIADEPDGKAILFGPCRVEPQLHSIPPVKLVCPACKQPIIPDGADWKCPACARPFTRNQGILSFLTPEERFNESVYEAKHIAAWTH